MVACKLLEDDRPVRIVVSADERPKRCDGLMVVVVAASSPMGPTPAVSSVVGAGVE